MTWEQLGASLLARQERGRVIAATSRLTRRSNDVWLVPSQSHGGTYTVDMNDLSCTCLDHETRGAQCKHIHAVKITRTTTTKPDGTTVVKETMKVTYGQDWPAYNRAQVHEKDMVEVLLKALCASIVQPPQGRGRPCLPMSDAVYGATMKVYTTMSGRRASSDIRACRAKGHITKAPHYNSIFNYLKKPELTPLLKSMIERSAEPLKAVENQFAVDATGFTTSTFARWYDHKWGREAKARRWIKAHAMVGCRTNIVTSIEVTAGNRHDSPEMPALVAKTAERFDVREVSADKAYLGHANLQAVVDAGATPYVPFKENSVDGGSNAWRQLWHCFWYRRAEFEQHYHQRSNVETTFSMIKRKFGGAVRSKLHTSQVNEVLCKVLCHNLAVLVHEMFELGIVPEFN